VAKVRLNTNLFLYLRLKIKCLLNKGVAGVGRPPSLLVVVSLKYSLYLLGLSFNLAKLTLKKVAMFCGWEVAS